MNLSIIVAIADNNAIGIENKLLCYLPNDLKWFKKITTNHTIIMGRKTFDSLPNGALPNRRNIVLSHCKQTKYDNCEVVNSLDELFTTINNQDENFVIGGAEIYRLLLPFVNKLYITKIHGTFEADVFFPEIDFSKWNLLEKIKNKADEKHKFDYDFLLFNKK
jgi:dihydrofolate reductase